jgi:hypothetical protein
MSVINLRCDSIFEDIVQFIFTVPVPCQLREFKRGVEPLFDNKKSSSLRLKPKYYCP